MRSTEPFPAITLSAVDHGRLSALVETVADTAPDVYEYLSRELDRATVTESRSVAPSVVAMNAAVTYRDETTGHSRRVVLVYPTDADLEKGRLSVLTPIGAALIGVAEGHSIRWYDRQGEARTLTVLAVAPAG